MKAQTFFLVASAFSGALAVPLRERAVDVYTVTSDVVDVVSITSTVWVSPSEYTVAAQNVQTQTEAAPAYTPSTTHHRHADFHSKVASSSTPVAVIPTSTPTVEAVPSTSTTPIPSTSTTPIVPSTTVVPTTSSTPVFTPSTSTAPTTSFSPLAVSTPSTTYAPSTTEAPATSTPVYSAPASTTAASSGGSGSGGLMSGDATYFITGLGSCGETNTDEDMIVAISHTLMDAAGGSNGNPLCGKKIKATCGTTGKSGMFTVADRCVGCAPGDLDFTEAGFESLGHELGDGRFQITWEYV